VHHVLAGDGSTDRALSAAYVRAYRALPRYDASQKPGLWLHRIAYLAATDELRRVTRDPVRRRALADVGRAEAGTDAPRHHAGLSTHDAHHLSTIDLTGSDELLLLDFATDQDAEADAGADELEGAIVEARGLMALDPDADDHASLPPGWRRLAPDQRALAVLVDLEGHRLADAARALDASTAAAADRLEATRRLLSRSSGGPTDTDPTGDRPPSPCRLPIPGSGPSSAVVCSPSGPRPRRRPSTHWSAWPGFTPPSPASRPGRGPAPPPPTRARTRCRAWPSGPTG
jgi:DNA-directed RNA polymerase specialized sigma24 family protein